MTKFAGTIIVTIALVQAWLFYEMARIVASDAASRPWYIDWQAGVTMTCVSVLLCIVAFSELRRAFWSGRL